MTETKLSRCLPRPWGDQDMDVATLRYAMSTHRTATSPPNLHVTAIRLEQRRHPKARGRKSGLPGRRRGGDKPWPFCGFRNQAGEPAVDPRMRTTTSDPLRKGQAQLEPEESRSSASVRDDRGAQRRAGQAAEAADHHQDQDVDRRWKVKSLG